jgi:hypothetical protein
MERMDELVNYHEIHALIVPTVLIPLTMISVVISVVATFIAGLFGIKLKAEGPKRMLELLLKPRIIITAVLLNGAFIGGVWLYQYIDNAPTFMFNINRINKKLITPSDQTYPNNVATKNNFKSSHKYSGVEFKEAMISKIEGGAFGHATLAGNSLFVGTSKGYVFEIKRRTLEVVRKFYIGKYVSAGTIVWNNNVIFGEGVHATHHARIYSFDLKSGKLRKTFSTKGHTEVQPVVGKYQNQELLFFTAGADGLYAVKPDTKEEVWHKNDGHVDSSVVYQGNRVFIGTGRDKENTKKYRAYAVAYDFLTGEHLWKRELPASSWMQPALFKDEVCFVYGEVYFKSELGGVQCFYQNNGIPSQSYRNLGPVVSIPMVVDFMIYYADSNGSVCGIDTLQKRVSWCFKVKDNKGVSYSGVTYDPYRDVLLYPSKNDGLYVINRYDGSIIQHYNPKNWGRNYANLTVGEEGWYTVNMAGLVRFISATK